MQSNSNNSNNKIKRIGLRHGSSMVLGIVIVKKGLDLVENGEILLGSALIITGAALIIFNYYKGLSDIHEEILGKVRAWL